MEGTRSLRRVELIVSTLDGEEGEGEIEGVDD
jgi:hypothetical protein